MIRGLVTIRNRRRVFRLIVGWCRHQCSYFLLLLLVRLYCLVKTLVDSYYF